MVHQEEEEGLLMERRRLMTLQDVVKEEFQKVRRRFMRWFTRRRKKVC